MHVSEMLEQIHARLQVKLARQGISLDREMLEDICLAIACLAQDPDDLLLHISPPPAEDYAAVKDGFALHARRAHRGPHEKARGVSGRVPRGLHGHPFTARPWVPIVERTANSHRAGGMYEPTSARVDR